MNHFAVYLKLTQRCRSTIFQLKKKRGNRLAIKGCELRGMITSLIEIRKLRGRLWVGKHAAAAAAAAAKPLQSCPTLCDSIDWTMHPTRLRRPWDSPGKNAGVGCHFLLQYMKVKSETEVTQLCPTLSDPMDCSAPGSSVHEIFQAEVLEWGLLSTLI